MRTPLEFLQEANGLIDKTGDAYSDLADAMILAILSAQKEAWNEAIDAAAENVSLIEIGYTPQDTDFVCNDMGDIYGIDKQSILKLKR